LSDSPFRNAAEEVAYVGSDQCSACHPDQHRSYLETFHSRSLGLIEPDLGPPDAAFEDAASGRHYASRREAGRLWHEEALPGPDGLPVELQSHPLAYRVGSGHFGHSYLIEDDGFLVQSPLTWYTPRQEWDLSPGYDREREASFQRTVSTECLFCHAGRFEAVDGNPHKPRIHELAIGCERCHGPGALHVERWAAGETATAELDETIVHPRRLPRARSEAICAQCHLQSEVQVAVRGRALDQFRPGLPLEDFRYEFHMQSPGQEMTVVGHVEQLRASRCYQESETLTCITCHDPHQSVPPERRDAVRRETCLTCHQPDSCGLDLAVRQQRAGDRCVECHMPESDTEVPHVAFTHHRIGVHGGPQPPSTEAETSLLTCQDLSRLPPVERDRLLGLAYWLYFKKHAEDPRWGWCLVHAAELLERAAEHGVQDPVLEWALAEIASREGRSEAARRLAAQVLTAESRPRDDRTQALRLLAAADFQAQRFESASRRLEELVQARRNAGDWFYLGLCAQNAGRTDQAFAALERSLEIHPAQAGSHAALAAMYDVRGDAERAAFHREREDWLAKRAARSGRSPNADRR
jgi:predicted CXXCH cytochrome family protein